ncbi:GMC family oxidoreductase [Dongia sedimenti]|uniref:GMC family oxidoreductase N-terminal domain-containing protein n=1 Tax=Dongia sedimenti TaxID=3064282 RepID=A0ABU0YQ27_9PROT|nr:GMC family oxidoreductase N-terminal domain-containing protein [Rhodospirillaceae bacterium R-7]
MDQFDYIIVGAGSAGCVLANRLSAEGSAGGKHKVLLLEAGPWDHRFWIQVPIGYGKTFYDGRFNWKYQTESDPGLGDRTSYWPRGKVIGGSSSINAMVYVRGQAEDFDDWEKAGNPGWGWRDVLPAYRRMEDHALGESPYHGTGGPLHVTEISKTAHPLTAEFIKAGQEAGLAFNPDLNGATQEGVGYYQITTRSGFRLSSARAYLWPALWRRNLVVRTNALATQIRFEGKRAVGVAYRYGNRVIEVRARREVILSGGAINSPQLLQLSGVGPAALLRSHGIAVVQDSPMVGRNLQDHLCYDHVYRARRPSLNNDLYPWWGKLRAALRYVLTRGGPLSLSVNQGGGFFRTRPDLARPDMQLYFSPLTYERTPPGIRPLMHPDPFPGFTTSASPCRPTSRGVLEIRSADPAAPPRIEPNYLTTEQDIADLLAGARFLRRLAATPALRDLIDTELKPGLGAHTDAEFIADIRARSYSVFHPCGSCGMGPDPARAVVDPRLKVHGLEALRVIDAAIFPSVTSGNINAPSIMVGERGADLVLEDAQRSVA